VHTLNNVISVSNKQQLLLKAGLGYIYKCFKLSIPKGKFIETCNQNGLCSKSVNQFISFHEIYSKYPRIIICDLTFAEIITNWKNLEKKIFLDSPIHSLLAMDLKTHHTIIKVRGCPKRIQDEEDNDQEDDDQEDYDQADDVERASMEMQEKCKLEATEIDHNETNTPH